MDNFTHSVVVHCPDCLKAGKRYKLICAERNYSGYGVDMGNCPQCGHGFEISFKVDSVNRDKTWDILPFKERKIEETQADIETAKFREHELKEELKKVVELQTELQNRLVKLTQNG